jgi:hypothetical protein
MRTHARLVHYAPDTFLINARQDVNSDAAVTSHTPIFPGNTLAGAWGFEEGSATTTADSSGNNNGSLISNGDIVGAAATLCIRSRNGDVIDTGL